MRGDRLLLGEGDRISCPYFPAPDGGRHTTASDSTLGFLLTRDIALGVMPIGGRSIHRPDFAVRLEPPLPEWEGWIVGLLRDRSGVRQTIKESLCDFVHDATGYLARFGEAFYEIVSTDDGEGDSPIAAKVLERLPPGKIRRWWGAFHQIVPPHARQPGRPRVIRIPSGKIWRLQLPRCLGKPRAQRALLNRLRKLSRVSPEFALADMAAGHSTPGYDFLVYRRAIDAEVARRVRIWGSPPSLLRSEDTTEYFSTVRVIRFLRAQAAIREHLVWELNGLLARLDCRARIVVSGLPTVKVLDETIAALEKGTINFRAALEAGQV